MTTTFSTNNFLNPTINSLLGKASNNYTFQYVHFYNGAQLASPDTALVSANSVYANATAGINITSDLTAPALGVSVLAAPQGLIATNGLSGITTARILSTQSVGVIDTTASLVGGGGGAIVPSLSSTAGVDFMLSQLSLKMPQTLGTVMLNADLVNALVSIWTVTASNLAVCSSASIKVYSGAAPASADAVATGTLLVNFTTAASGASWGTVSGGAASLAGNLSAVAGNTGTAGYVRIEKGAYVLQGTVGTSAANFIIDQTSITSGNTITLTEATISL